MLPLLILGLPLVGCGEIPRPFAGAGNTELLAMPESFGVVVGEIRGMDPAIAAEARATIAEQLRRHETPASTQSSNRASYRLHGFSDPRTAQDEQPMLDWVVEDGTGAVRHRFQAPLALDGFAGADVVAAEVANAIRASQPARAAAAAIEAHRVPVAVADITNAPGDGNVALAKALRVALRQYGVQVGDDQSRAALVVAGNVRVVAQPQSRQRVELAWTVRDAGGQVVGNVSQSNEIRAGLLDREWGEIAAAAADGAAGGIAALVERIEAEKAAATAPALQR